ncbi:hypothetical protein GCM10018980_58440 [Streptomyces capoamus]|uniref:Uncharacterized protein n=1 Tax=Streptomyces capoamus TaxID=68183 RepID=A0A919F0L6_9ACTN|nr:hypothetical protein GCM10010501_48140 [Streptomyces libani subsp. rufus]GHG66226.1 hypothetical protein GCM10018980_58440 [Streptomyces capoamus]
MRNDAAYRAVVFGALRATTEDGPTSYAEEHALSAAVNRWAGTNGVGPVPMDSLVRLIGAAGYQHFRTERRGYFAGLAIKENGA